MGGSVIQVTGTAEFEHGQWIRNKSNAVKSSLQIRTTPIINDIINSRGEVDQIPLRTDKSPTC